MSDVAAAIATATAYLAAMEARDLDAARRHVAPGPLDLRFPGDRRMSAIEQIVANSGGRYQRIGKLIETRDGWDRDGLVRVMITGTLNGAWQDGTPFEGIRFVDWFEFDGGLIRRQHVWNDTGEWLVKQREART